MVTGNCSSYRKYKSGTIAFQVHGISSIPLTLCRHIRKWPAISVVVPEQITDKILRIYRVSSFLFKRGLTIINAKCIFCYNGKCLVRAYISKLHTLPIPFKFLVQILEAHSQHTHDDHLIERAGVGKSRFGLYPAFGTLLASAYPVQVVGCFMFHISHTNPSLGLRYVWHIAR